MPGRVREDAVVGDARSREIPERSRPRGANTGIAIVALVVVAAAVSRPLLERLLDEPAVAHWSTVFVAIAVQAMPFLVLGVTVSAAIAAFVPADFLPNHLPRRPELAVPVAAVAGAALPGCECGSVPIAGRLVSRGVPAAAALTFLLSAPAINPIVLVATAVAFPGQPEVVGARLLASLLAATVVGFVWARFGRDELLERARRRHVHEGPPLTTFVETAQHDLLHAGGFLIVGAAAAATLQTVVPRDVLDSLAGRGALSILALAGLAVALAICSEADAFVAASFREFSLDGVPGLHGGRPDGRREADLPTGRDLRAQLRDALRAADVHRCGLGERPRRLVAAVTAAGGAISLLVGTVLLRLTLTGTYQRYVREEMGPFLAVAGVVIIVLGLVTLRARSARVRRAMSTSTITTTITATSRSAGYSSPRSRLFSSSRLRRSGATASTASPASTFDPGRACSIPYPADPSPFG